MSLVSDRFVLCVSFINKFVDNIYLLPVLGTRGNRDKFLSNTGGNTTHFCKLFRSLVLLLTVFPYVV